MDGHQAGTTRGWAPTGTTWTGTTGRTDQPSGIGFMNVFKPPGFDDFLFVNVSDSDSACWNARAFKTSGSGRLGSATGIAIMLLGLLIPPVLQRL